MKVLILDTSKSLLHIIQSMRVLKDSIGIMTVSSKIQKVWLFFLSAHIPPNAPTLASINSQAADDYAWIHTLT